jgi:hypothetical protein
MINIYRLPLIISFTGIVAFAFVKFYFRHLHIQNHIVRFALGIFPIF